VSEKGAGWEVVLLSTDTAPATEDQPTDEQPEEGLANAVKFVGRDTIEGPVFRFGTRHLDGETFQPPPATDYCFDWFPGGRPLLYEHGLDGAMKTFPVGRQSDHEVRTEAVWAQSQLERNARYRKAIDGLIEQGALAYSGGAMAHLATKSFDGGLQRFPWVELSLTPTPMDPANAPVYFLKSAEALAHLDAASISIPDPLKAALMALDEWAENDGLPDGLKFADHVARVLGDVEAVRDRTRSIAGLRAKSGRVLSVQTRERLTRHPALLRELADDLDGLLSEADADKAAKHADLAALELAHQAVLARLRGVDIPAQGAEQ
jgi:hypothetical protein